MTGSSAGWQLELDADRALFSMHNQGRTSQGAFRQLDSRTALTAVTAPRSAPGETAQQVLQILTKREAGAGSARSLGWQGSRPDALMHRYLAAKRVEDWLAPTGPLGVVAGRFIAAMVSGVPGTARLCAAIGCGKMTQATPWPVGQMSPRNWTPQQAPK